MTIALWILNGVLALVFVASGGTKLARSKEAIVAGGMRFAEDLTEPIIKLLGLAEIVGAVGLIVPLLTGIAPFLTPIAAAALAVLMIGAGVVHVRRKEPSVVPFVLGALSVVSAALGSLVIF
jgi:uncharacterized membrane protein YphA (DoxX/SURF4 family)